MTRRREDHNPTRGQWTAAAAMTAVTFAVFGLALIVLTISGATRAGRWITAADIPAPAELPALDYQTAGTSTRPAPSSTVAGSSRPARICAVADPVSNRVRWTAADGRTYHARYADGGAGNLRYSRNVPDIVRALVENRRGATIRRGCQKVDG